MAVLGSATIELSQLLREFDWSEYGLDHMHETDPDWADALAQEILAKRKPTVWVLTHYHHGPEILDVYATAWACLHDAPRHVEKLVAAYGRPPGLGPTRISPGRMSWAHGLEAREYPIKELL